MSKTQTLLSRSLEPQGAQGQGGDLKTWEMAQPNREVGIVSRL